jgi:uncharacterized protein
MLQLGRSAISQKESWRGAFLGHVHEFIAVVTNKRIYADPTPFGVAFQQVERWAKSPTITFIGESTDHLETLSDISRAGSITGAMVNDARVAAICMDHGVSELWSADRDFSRFPQIKLKNPLIG